mmetsp:Transcript_27053/g.40652  ORF Transcript_27053/g.40652 Transcript_27053/m.40652 type:complete len:109 (-) Transcript_27053:78-404(-)
MRQVEKECNEMDWTQGAGLSSVGEEGNMTMYQGGTFRLGGEQSNEDNSQTMTARDLAARAALMRISKEEEEIQAACGCGGSIDHDTKTKKLVVHSESKTTSDQFKDEE